MHFSMASTSSSPSLPVHSFKHDVFLSFRGEDVRYSFVSHLHSALRQTSIRTFIDKKLERGEEISQSLLNAIEESVIAVVVFSKGYAFSRWCLDELAMIVECIETRGRGQKVIPVFYHVDPSDVRKQTGIFAEAFVGHEANFNSYTEKLKRWRAALTKAANQSGYTTAECRSESDIVDGIVKKILNDLQKMWPSPSKDLVGMGPRIEHLLTLLCSGSTSNVFILGLWGMGGIGKTTLAQALFGQIKCRFEKCCFLANVREESEKRGLEKLGKKLVYAVLGEKIKRINMSEIGRFFDIPRGTKVLLVLDDVDHREQPEFLIGDRRWYGAGSRIIITSRDKQLLNNFVDDVYEVETLSWPDSFQLFRLHAFKDNVPTNDEEELSSSIVRYVNGVPLALKVLGSSLLGKRKREWESTVKKLENTPNKEIQDVLRISYNTLEEEQKKIFLWIACCLKNKEEDDVIKFLDSCGFSTEIELSVLNDKSLVSKHSDLIEMHNLLQEMGGKIVREESEDPIERRFMRKWQDIYEVFKKNSGTKKIEGIILDTSQMEKEVWLQPDTFAKMPNLKFLEINDEWKFKSMVQLPTGINALPDELRWLHWNGYPLESLPANFNPENLIHLGLPNSNVIELFRDEMQLNPDGCGNWCKVSSSTCRLSNVTRIDMSYSPKLRSLPDLGDCKSLRDLMLSGCSNLKSPPKVPGSIAFLYLSGTAIKEVSVEYLDNLEMLVMDGCSQLESFSSNTCRLSSVIEIQLTSCPKLKSLPDFRNCKSLRSLNLSGCSNLKSFPKVPRCIEFLDLCGTAIKEMPSASVEYLDNLKTLVRNGCVRYSCSQLQSFSRNVTLLNLGRWDNFCEVCSSTCHLISLIEIQLISCPMLKSLPDLRDCKSLRKFKRPLKSQNFPKV